MNDNDYEVIHTVIYVIAIDITLVEMITLITIVTKIPYQKIDVLNFIF